MSGPIRGLHDVEGQLYTVSGPTLYRITPAGVAIPLGQIPGVGRVSMAHNQVAGGHQLTIVNGVGGYVWNTANQQFNVITDEGFPGSSRVDFIDGYMMHVEPFGRFLLHSDLADALDFNTLDRFEAETAPDRTTTLIVNGTEVWAFGERTIDVFYNAGTAQGTFQNKKVGITTGCIAGASPAICDGGVAWLGDDRVVYHARGYSPTRISTRALDVVLSECSLSDIRNSFSFVYADRGHTIYYLTIPNGMTFGYDFSAGLWHRRASWHPEEDVYGRWCLSDLVRSNGKWIGGDYRTGKLYELDWDYPLEGCEPLIRERTSPVLHNNGNRVEVHEVQPLFDTGRPTVECVPFKYQPVGPQISGEAPDGLTDEAYSFTYTTTPGSSPIARTVLRDTTLPAGWLWNEQTATISHPSPLAGTIVSLVMRVYDTNGLFADHADTLVISESNHLLATGVPVAEGADPFAQALALAPMSFGTIPEDTGADINNALPEYCEGTWVAASGTAARYSTDNRQTWQSGSISLSSSLVNLSAGPDGWVASTATGPDYFAISGPTPDEFSPHPTGIMANLGSVPEAIVNPGRFRYVAGKWWMTSSGTGVSAGAWMTAPTLATELWVVVGGVRTNATYWYDICEWDGALWATCRHDTYLDNARFQLKRSNDGGATWTPVILSGIDARPWQLAAGDDCLLVLAYGGHVAWTSEDDFATARSTGIQTATSATTVQSERIGRLIRYAAPTFYIASGAFASDPTMANKCVTTTRGLEFSAAVPLGITSAKGIAVGPTTYEEPDDE